MPTVQASRSGAILAATGLAAALVLSGTAHAGPFQWLTGKNQQQQPPQQYQEPPQQESGNSPGFFPFFGGKGNRPNRGYQAGTDPTAAPRASELPANDPEAYMITNPPLGVPTLSSRNVAATQSAIQRYQSIAAQGGWPMVPAKAMHPGQRGPEVAALQRRLEVSGDLVGMSVPGEYDAAVVQAVKIFQSRHGLPATGKIDSKAMIEALNVPASIRVAQLQASLKRLQSLSANTGGGRYVVVNAGISGNRLLDQGRSPSALSRLDRDVLSLPRVDYVVLLEGINDIRHSGPPNLKPGRTAKETIAAYRQIVGRLSDHRITVLGATLTPFEGSDRYDATSEATLSLNALVSLSGGDIQLRPRIRCSRQLAAAEAPHALTHSRTLPSMS